MDSQGGLNTAGLHAYSFLCEVPKLTIHVRGWAASMAPVILQAATVRRMDREAHMMIHKSTMSIERVDADTFMLEAESLKVWSKQVIRIIASRSRLSEEELHERTLHRDWYLTAPEALELGFADEVR
jgi:ATP-dependent protease ClpP protease subunit